VSRSGKARALANGLMSCAERLLPLERSSWAKAMRAELQHIDGDYAALAWAFGCCVSSFKLLIGERVMKRELTVSFTISAAFGVLTWWLSPLVTGHVEPWDANSAFYLAALMVTGLVAGLICPRRIWPVLPGVALGQFAYMLLFLPKGPLIAVGFVSLFVYGLLAIATAFVGSRLRRAWVHLGFSSRP
jgi:hypothetical protein